MYRTAVVWLIVAFTIHWQTVVAQPSSPGDGIPEELSEAVEALADALAERYVDADSGADMSEALRMSLISGDYDGIASGSYLAQRLQQQLFEIVEDRHLSVSYVPRGVGTPPSAEAREAISQQARTAIGPIPKVEILRGNIGIIQIDAFPSGGDFAAALDAAFALVGRTEALIIDVRANRGGDPDNVTLLASYLLEDAPRLLQTIHWPEDDGVQVQEYWTSNVGVSAYGESRPVAVLISSVTASGGEGFAYHMQAFERAVLLGENTVGAGLVPVGPEQITQTFSASIPQGRPVHPVTGGGWEGTGVAPDIEVAQSDVIESAEMALFNLLAESESSETMRSIWAAYSINARIKLNSAGDQFITVAALEGDYEVVNGRGNPFSVVPESERMFRLRFTNPGGQEFLFTHIEGDTYATDPISGSRTVYTISFSTEDGIIRSIWQPRHLSYPPVRALPAPTLSKKR